MSNLIESIVDFSEPLFVLALHQLQIHRHGVESFGKSVQAFVGSHGRYS